MSASKNAEIIPFPARVPTQAHVKGGLPGQITAPQSARGAAPGAAQQSPDDARLAAALASLNEALDSQRTAMAAWASALGDLRDVTRRLGTSLVNYNERLSRLDGRVALLRTEAVRLERWADGVLAREA